MLAIKPRLWLLGTLAMLLVGSFAAASAEAQGPYFYHRGINGQGKGVKLGGQQAGARPFEEVRGGGEGAKLESKLAGAVVEIKAAQVQVKGIVYNNALQGQAKLTFAYINPVVTTPPNCGVRVGTDNTVHVVGHQVWTWDKTEAQLKEQPQQHQKPEWIFLHEDLVQGAKELPTEETFTTLTLSGGTCAIAGTASVKGSAGASIKPEQVGAFGTSQVAESLENGVLQHFWNGTENRGAEINLKLGAELAKLKQSATVSNLNPQTGAKDQELGLWGD